MWPKVVDYVKWQRALRQAQAEGKQLPDMPDLAIIDQPRSDHGV